MIGLRGILGRPQPGAAASLDAPADARARDAAGGGEAAHVDAPRQDPVPVASVPDARIATLVARDVLKRRAMVSARVVADPVRCVECGICSFNCPLGIDVRMHVRRGLPVSDSYCLTCGECVARCPRGTLRFEESAVFAAGPAAEDA